MSYFPCPKPKCDGILDLKQAKRGPKKGEYFYGCTNFSAAEVNCKVTSNKEDILNYLHTELFGVKTVPQPVNGLLWSDNELNIFNSKQLAMICHNNGYDVGYETIKDNLINFIKYYQTTYYKSHNGCLLFSKPINSEYILNFNYTFLFDDENKYSDKVLDLFLNTKQKSIPIKNYLNKSIGKAFVTRKGIELKLSESISNGMEYELLTIIDLQKKNCKSFVVSGEATLDLFNSEEELFLDVFLANS